MMHNNYNPVATGRGTGDHIASFDLEIASNRQRHDETRSALSGRHLIAWFFFASVAVASFCIFTGILEVPKGIAGAPVRESGEDNPSNDYGSGWNDDDWEPSSGYDEQDNTNQEAEAEQQNINEYKVTKEIKFVYCYGDSLTAGYIPNESENHPYGPALQSELNNLYRTASAAIAPQLQHPPNIIVQSTGYPGMPAKAMIKNVEHEYVGACRAVEHSPKPSVVIILAGTNDLMRVTPDLERPDDSEALHNEGRVEVILGPITTLYKAVLACSARVGGNDMMILSVGIPGSRFQVEHPAASDIAAKVNEGLSEFSSNYSGPSGKIVYTDFPFEYEESDSKWAPDGLHLTALGYDELGKRLAPVVKSVLDMMYDDL